MSTIDITLPPALAVPLKPPLCAEFGLAAPPATLATVTLPMGATLTGIADFTRGIPSDCAMNFSLIAMIAPIMASLTCPLALLKLVGDLINAAKPPPNPVALLTVLTDAEAALADCLSLVTPAGICPFVKTVLLLIVSMLNCFLQALNSVVNLMDGLSPQIDLATQNGNTDQLAELHCALQNAQSTAAGTLSSIQPLTSLLQIAQPFFSIVGVSLGPMPSVSGELDIAPLKQLINDLAPVVSGVQAALQAVPC
jgi:hypothetical protein